MRFFRKMKFFSRKRNKSRDLGGGFETASEKHISHAGWATLSGGHGSPTYGDSDPSSIWSRSTPASAGVLGKFPPRVLDRIFGFVCPHTLDESYDNCELSAVEDTCALCDLRDLAHSIATCRAWRREGVKRLYHSIRIDIVHFCPREALLAEQRKRRSRFDTNGESENTSSTRLKLLCRTLREDPARLGPLVLFLKLPYMLRESSPADLARTIAVLPSLHYVDLPEGLFRDESAYMTLRLEVQARCRELRKMTFMSGAERSLEALGSGTVWLKLEVLELERIDMDPLALRQVLSVLSNLRALKVSEMPIFTDDMVEPHGMLPPFPALEELVLSDIPHISAAGLTSFLSEPRVRNTLRVLTLTTTGVKVWTLHEILVAATQLKHLSITETITVPLATAAATKNIPPLVSPSLETLHFEITLKDSSGSYSSALSSYYGYLAGSLLSGGLPQLRALYVRDTSFPDMLLLGISPTIPSFGGATPPRSASPGPASGFLLPGSPERYQNSLPSPTSSASLSSPAHTGQSVPGLLASKTGSSLQSRNPFLSPSQATGTRTLSHTLEVFTKGEDDIGWNFVQVGPSPRDKRQSRRPLSSYGLGADVSGAGGPLAWSAGAGARRSVMVTDGGGGFLAVPGEMYAGYNGPGGSARGSFGSAGGAKRWEEEGEELWPRPRSANIDKRKDDIDLWR